MIIIERYSVFILFMLLSACSTQLTVLTESDTNIEILGVMVDDFDPSANDSDLRSELRFTTYGMMRKDSSLILKLKNRKRFLLLYTKHENNLTDIHKYDLENMTLRYVKISLSPVTKRRTNLSCDYHWRHSARNCHVFSGCTGLYGNSWLCGLQAALCCP